jgi:hypothetical protein
MNRHSILNTNKRLFSFVYGSHRLWGGGGETHFQIQLVSGVLSAGVKAPTQFHRVPRLRMSGADFQSPIHLTVVVFN